MGMMDLEQGPALQAPPSDTPPPALTDPVGLGDLDNSNPGASEPGTGYGEAAYRIFVPVKDNDGNDVPEVLMNAIHALDELGFSGSTVARGFEGRWGEYVEPMDIIEIVAPDDQDTTNKMIEIAKGVQFQARQKAVYLTKQPIQSFLVGLEDPAGQDMPEPDMGMGDPGSEPIEEPGAEGGDIPLPPELEGAESEGVEPVAPVV